MSLPPQKLPGNLRKNQKSAFYLIPKISWFLKNISRRLKKKYIAKKFEPKKWKIFNAPKSR